MLNATIINAAISYVSAGPAVRIISKQSTQMGQNGTLQWEVVGKKTKGSQRLYNRLQQEISPRKS